MANNGPTKYRYEVIDEIISAGGTYKDVMKALDVTRSTAINFIKDYRFEKPTRGGKAQHKFITMKLVPTPEEVA